MLSTSLAFLRVWSRTFYMSVPRCLLTSICRKICNTYMALGARGISVIYASGDGGVRGAHDGVSECPVNTFTPVFPASCPFVTSVGATLGVQPELAINFTGGGFSDVFASPSYQTTAVSGFLATLPSDFAGVFNKSGRGYPDVGHHNLGKRERSAYTRFCRSPRKDGTLCPYLEVKPVLMAVHPRQPRASPALLRSSTTNSLLPASLSSAS
jgi:hypothetical protein